MVQIQGIRKKNLALKGMGSGFRYCEKCGNCVPYEYWVNNDRLCFHCCQEFVVRL